MWPDRVSNLGPLTYESGALATALRGPANDIKSRLHLHTYFYHKTNKNCQENI